MNLWQRKQTELLGIKPKEIKIMKDIESRQDLELLMQTFYQKLLKDEGVNYIFTDIAKINLEQHLPIITDFWEQNILNTGTYKNNVLKIHQDLNGKVKLSEEHFSIWLRHFDQTVDTLFSGEKANTIKTRALSIATVMKIKLT